MSTKVLQKNIPKGWRVSKLSEIVDIINGKTPSRRRSEYWDSGNIPWFTIEDIRNQGREISSTRQHITTHALKASSIKLLPKNSILLCCTASVGEYAYAHIPLTTNQQFNGLVIKDKNIVFPKFLYYFSATLKNKLNSLTGATTFGFVSTSKIGEIAILLPHVSEQKRIAEILKSVDEEIQKTDEVIAVAKKLKHGLMQELFSHGIGHTKFKETKIGTIPMDWDVVKLSNVASINPKQIDPTIEHFKNQYFKYVDIGSINNYKVVDIKKFIGSDAPIRARRVIQTGDVLISTVRPNLRTITKITSLTQNLLASTGFCVLRETKRITSDFLYQISLTEQFTAHLTSNVTGSNYPAVSPTIIEEFSFGLPPLIEQQKISQILSSADEKISINQILKIQLALLKKNLMHDLLNGKVRID